MERLWGLNHTDMSSNSNCLSVCGRGQVGEHLSLGFIICKVHISKPCQRIIVRIDESFFKGLAYGRYVAHFPLLMP